ncbi:TOMM system kinase/cyclase fusion protein [Desulfobacterota bacterium AH_259_B03_O07]|nr:TOMM system kinase/cyclase fusion protein [Desulfobacterota bacterium AH_259_B03_O07]
MICTGCGSENSDEAKFCIECGVPLANRCPNCGSENLPQAKFCSECGTSIKNKTSKTPHIVKQKEKEQQLTPQVSRIKALESERRQLTVMFCDLVGSTAISEQLDPEELHKVMSSYQEVCAEVISRFEGHIAKYLGDGILVYFGYPQAHEDDAYRSVRAGLEIVGGVNELHLRNTQLNQTLHVRVGIHTGLVMVGEIGAGDTREPMAIVGDTPNIASRLQELAEPNTVMISAPTFHLIEGFFTCKSLGSQNLKGLSQPIESYQVLQESGVQSRFEVAVSKGLTPLVGREQEVGLLLERWDRAKEGEGQVVLLCGEAGIGKSRLAQLLKDHVEGESHTRIESRCSPFYQNSALYPVIYHLQRFLEFRSEDSPQEKLIKLENTLERYDFSPQEVVPLFAPLLSLPLPDHYESPKLTPQRQKQKTLEALIEWLFREAENQPVIRIVEDLHWIDPSTLEYLSLLVEQVPTAPILTLLTFRPDFIPPWTIRAHITQITLNRLSQKQVRVMSERLSRGKTLPSEVVQQLVTKTDGVPLFVEELTKMVLESGLLIEQDESYELAGPLPPLAIPSTLQESLIARLDRLETVKELAQLGATLGREFTYELLQAVSSLDETTLQRGLAKLVEAELLYQRGTPPQSRYIFKHALIQDTAYQSLLKSKRHLYHQKITKILEEKFPDTAETQPELLAHHHTEAGLVEQAIPYLKLAGQRARERSANMEAISHLTKGLELLKSMPDKTDRTRIELDLLITLGPALTAVKGWASPEVEQAYSRARELCEREGETVQLYTVLWVLGSFYLVRAEHNSAYDLGKRLLKLAEHNQDSDIFLAAHHHLGMASYCLGNFALAGDHLDQAVALYNPQKHHSHTSLFGSDLGVFCQSWLSHALWQLGYPDRALKISEDALALAQELSHPLSHALARDYAAMFHQLRRDSNDALERSEEAIALCAEQGFVYYLAWGTIIHGWASAERGQAKKAIEQMHQGLADLQSTGAQRSLPYYLSLLAEAYFKADRAEEGLSLLTEALSFIDEKSERWWEAELYRLKGELLLKLNDTEPGIEESFRKAIEIARRQSAKSLELRAVMSLSRFLHKHGKNDEAIKVLSEIYGWFTEGFDTADLKEAKSLLGELS